jgi:hypothetical protein
MTIQRQDMSSEQETEVPEIVHEILKSPGQFLEPATRTFMESRFAQDFRQVKVHIDTKAAESARAVNALAYTVGHNVVFGENQFSPYTISGKTLLAHELVHVLQQRGSDKKPSNISPNPPLNNQTQTLSKSRDSGSTLLQTSIAKTNSLQRQLRQGSSRRTQPNQRLEFHPSRISSPCACLVFIHNDERNARSAAEDLHHNCHYNLAIIGAGQDRRVPIRGSSGRIDPNELFPNSIQEECTRDEVSCVVYEASHDDQRAMEIQFFLTIKRCSEGFMLPTVALHNNALGDTSRFLRRTSQSDRQQMAGRTFLRESTEPVTSRAGLRRYLRSHRGIMYRSGTTNIFRWCNLPEISRCHIGDPDNPDHLIWVTTVGDYDLLSRERVNVVLQEGLNEAEGSESDRDLSTLFTRLGTSARFVNIETPNSPETQDMRRNNMQFIQNVLSDLNLDCCEPASDFPSSSQSE